MTLHQKLHPLKCLGPSSDYQACIETWDRICKCQDLEMPWWQTHGQRDIGHFLNLQSPHQSMNQMLKNGINFRFFVPEHPSQNDTSESVLMHSQIIWINDILHWISTCGHVGSINLQIKLCECKIGKGSEVQVILQYLHLHSVMHIKTLPLYALYPS